ncbi:MAG: TetR/AcrR family transcriptional regulator [Lactobacillus sp.]|jgi:AcrR family transcriptional regulator|nr:TetR/AcrR family transcriptional regulator [Lactobacillus sp.]MCI2034250.1 TetR/AcrR family transcriptional regulator [Lactobacillus sp.]
MTDEATRRAQMIAAVNETIVQTGFVSLTMNEIARIMGVSRAKLYQYFPSKDAVVAAVVDRYFQFMAQQKLPTSTAPEEFVEAFATVFLQLVTLVASSSDVFRADLTRTMPERAQEFATRYREWMLNLKQFLTTGQALGAFNRSIVPELFCIQVESIVPALMNNERLVEYRLDVHTVLLDYLRMMVSQVVSPSWQSHVDVSRYQDEIARLTTKYQQTLVRM